MKLAMSHNAGLQALGDAILSLLPAQQRDDMEYEVANDLIRAALVTAMQTMPDNALEALVDHLHYMASCMNGPEGGTKQ